MSYSAGQHVRVMHSGATGRVFLKLPLREVYLVQFPGFPVVEKIYNGCDLEPLTAAPPVAEPEPVHHHASRREFAAAEPEGQFVPGHPFRLGASG